MASPGSWERSRLSQAVETALNTCDRPRWRWWYISVIFFFLHWVLRMLEFFVDKTGTVSAIHLKLLTQRSSSACEYRITRLSLAFELWKNTKNTHANWWLSVLHLGDSERCEFCVFCLHLPQYLPWYRQYWWLKLSDHFGIESTSSMSNQNKAEYSIVEEEKFLFPKKKKCIRRKCGGEKYIRRSGRFTSIVLPAVKI